MPTVAYRNRPWRHRDGRCGHAIGPRVQEPDGPSGQDADEAARDVVAEAAKLGIAFRKTTTVLHQPFVNPNNVKWRFADQRAAAVLNCAAQADIVRACALCGVVW